MSDRRHCPDPDELRLLLLGQLAAARASEVEGHLDACHYCVALIGTIQVESQLMDALKAQPVGCAASVPADLEHLMTTLDSLHPCLANGSGDLGGRDDSPAL